MFCGTVVLLATRKCLLLESLRERLRSTCLFVDVRTPDSDQQSVDQATVSSVAEGCSGLWFERTDVEPIVRESPPQIVTDAFVSGDADKLASELAGLAECSLTTPRLLDEFCLDCAGEGIVCTRGRRGKADCVAALGFPPVPWDIGAALCAAHEDCVGLALSLPADIIALGLQHIQPPTLGAIVAGSRYAACAETRPGDSILVIPSVVAPAPPRVGASVMPLTGISWLDCTGAEFSNDWNTFYQLLVQVGLRNLVYDSVPEFVGDYAAYLLGNGKSHPYDKADLFRAVLAGEQPPESLGGYCFGGAVVARIATLRVLNEKALQATEYCSSNAEVSVQCEQPVMSADVLADLVHVRSSLGHQLAQDFLHCCSRWTFVKGVDLSDLIESERKWQKPEPPDYTGVASEARLMIHHVPETIQAISNAPLRSLPRSTSLGVCVFGLFHFGTIEDAVTLLQVALSAVQAFSVRVVHNKEAIKEFYNAEISGAGRVDDYVSELCSLLSCELAVPPWNELFRILDTRYEEHSAQLLSSDLFELAQRTANVLEHEGSCDLVASANMDLVYMSLLSRAFPDAKLLYFATDSVLPHDTKGETLQLRLLSEELFFRSGSRGRLIVTCEKLQVQTFYQLGHWPHLAVAAMLGRQGKLRRMPEGVEAEVGQVVVFGRAALRMTPVQNILEAFLDANPDLDVQLTFAKGALPFDSWSSFRACVFLPWNFHAVSFVEFVSLNVPLLVPVGALAYTFIKAFNSGFRQDSSVYYTNDAGTWRKGPDMPSPFWNNLPSQPSRRQFLFWYELSHMRMRPGVCSFSTFFELLQTLNDWRALQSVRLEMRAGHLAEVAMSARVVASAVHALFGG